MRGMTHAPSSGVQHFAEGGLVQPVASDEGRLGNLIGEHLGKVIGDQFRIENMLADLQQRQDAPKKIDILKDEGGRTIGAVVNGQHVAINRQ